VHTHLESAARLWSWPQGRLAVTRRWLRLSQTRRTSRLHELRYGLQRGRLPPLDAQHRHMRRAFVNSIAAFRLFQRMATFVQFAFRSSVLQPCFFFWGGGEAHLRCIRLSSFALPACTSPCAALQHLPTSSVGLKPAESFLPFG